MGAIIKMNGVEVQEALAIVDTANNKVTLETMLDNGRELDLRKVYVEVNIYGNANMYLRERSLHGSFGDNGKRFGQLQ